MFKRLLFTSQRGTIFALSTPPGKSAIAVIRISGNLCTGLFPASKPRHAKYSKLVDNDGQLIDTAIVTYFKAPRSYTGEDVLEIATHGSISVINKLCDHLEFNGCRKAEKGEFTYRAYLNNKMSVKEIESLSSLLDSETELQRKMALLPQENDSSIIDRWKNKFVTILATYEAQIDFGEDENIDINILDTTLNDLQSISDEIAKYLKDAQIISKMRQGIRVSICGIPNSGKSSFINLLCKDQVSIVSDISGTTRDVIQRYVNFNGYPLVISDTAGIRLSNDTLENIGIEKAYNEIEKSDILFFIFDPTQDRRIQLDLMAKIASPKSKMYVLVNKMDISKDYPKIKNQILISCRGKIGLTAFYNILINQLNREYSIPSSFTFQSRFVAPLNEILKLISKFNENELVLKAEILRNIIQQIELLGSTVDLEHVLDSLFSQFCIGK
eukprot:NODE_141_length_17903_cov_0.288643.p3 type:complete len:442 gc:universal NODE_141_length_17903_cov_0.288643:1787-462(-)